MKANNIFLGIGTNLGDRKQNLKLAISEIENFARIIKTSSIYESEPYGFKDQNDFFNIVIQIETLLSPEKLFQKLQNVEKEMGRDKNIKNGPRIIDIDILLFNDEIITSETLIIPHSEMHERNFVLMPFSEIAGETLHPILKKDINTLLKNLKSQGWIRKK